MKYSISGIFNKLRRQIWWHSNVRIFRSLGKSSFVDSPLRIDGPENITIGKNVTVKYKTWLAAMPLTDTQSPNLTIDDGSIIGNFNHIYATNTICIGKNVLIADKVYISDNIHEYSDYSSPIMNQGVKQLNRVLIGDGAWIGENVCILGASIGKNCVIGANAVVTKDIPDFCVAVGSPAKIIKQYNPDSKIWSNLKSVD